MRKKLNAMALEFVGKNVLIVDGERVSYFMWETIERRFVTCCCRFDRARHNVAGDHPDGEGRWSKKSDHGVMRTSDPVPKRVRDRYALSCRARRARTDHG